MMPLVPEVVIVTAIGSRIGAIHSVVFGGFSPPSLADRIIDSNSSCIITAQDANRRGKKIPLRSIVSDALKSANKSIPIINLNAKETTDFDLKNL